jgi:hypothetical protein
VRAAASACLVASGLLISGVGGAMALADPGHGQSDDRRGSDGHTGDDSMGDVVRRAFGLDDGAGQKSSDLRQQPDTRLGNGRGEDESTKTDTPPTKTDTPPTDTTKPTTPTTKPTTPTTKPTTPCPEPTEPTEPSEPPGQPGPTPPASVGGGGGGAIVQLPRFNPPSVPEMQLPNELRPTLPGLPGTPGVLDAGAGAVAVAAPAGPAVPIALPVIVVPPLGLGVGGGPGGGAAAGLPPAAPRGVPAQPPSGRISPPANVGSNAAVPNASYRIGYTQYLRTAGLPQVAALAVPGLFGIMVLTGAGGLVGYRQAKAGHAVRVGGSARFVR